MLCHALDATGLKDYRIGLGDASLYPGADGQPRRARATPAPRLLEALVVARLRRARAARSPTPALPARPPSCCSSVPQRRGGPEVLADAPGRGAERRRPACASVHELLEPAVAERVIFDLGLVRNIGYYTGAVFDVYDPALGAPIGGGGRYDDLLGRFGRAPARRRLRARRRPPAHRARRRGARHRALLAPSTRSEQADAAPVIGRRAHEPDQRPHDRRAARRAVRRHASTCSTALGLDTAELRSNDRKLLFEDIGVITMRPSDVPTYVEAGAADLGITGKDVLLEQGGPAPTRRGRPRGLRAARPRLRALHDGARQQGRPRPRRTRRCAASASCASPPSTRASPRATSRRPAARPRSSRSRARSSSRR